MNRRDAGLANSSDGAFVWLSLKARRAAIAQPYGATSTRYHRVFAPHNRWRTEVTPAGFRQGRPGGLLGAGQSAVRQSSGFAAICRPVTVRLPARHAERLVAFSCKRRGFCPSCGARRMVETAALLVDEVLPRQPLRQWVLSVPFPLRFLFATEPAAVTAVLGIVYRAISTHLIRKAGFRQTTAQAGAVTLIQRFGGALNLNIHCHLLVLDGVYVRGNERLEFRRVPPPEP